MRVFPEEEKLPRLPTVRWGVWFSPQFKIVRGGGNGRGEGEAEGRAGSRAEGSMRDGSSMDLHDNNNVEDSFTFGGWQKRTTRAILTVWRRIKAAFGDG